MARLDDIDTELKEKIALRIKALRMSTGKIQSAFAIDAEKDRQTINRWEGGRGISIYSINKFCKDIGIELWEFFRYREFLNFPEKDSNKDIIPLKENQ
ncbi:helix-turn-helix domain-containing protein [Rhizosphaericola mali]|uniref:helix-turn-helix domain-containing protein n=1 Tax=Rhizosphaericola mali TaxID=2545455 RepID=UPI00177DB899|nr:helix-turn-helix transcriptional regulator [Rhizosphaericola mali]